MIKDFFKKFFGPIEEFHATGALIEIEDPRNIPASAVQEQLPEDQLPEEFETDISMLPILDQGQLGACVGHAMAYAIMMFEWLEKKKIIKVSPRFIYGLAKQRDGRPNDEGTYPRVAAGVIKELGAATTDTLMNDVKMSHERYTTFELNDTLKNDASPRKVAGYVFPEVSRVGIKNAIFKNKFVTGSLKYGDWRKLPVQPAEDKGNHYIFIYGWAKNGKFKFINSWGVKWQGDGKGYFLWADYEGKCRDFIAYTDVPASILEEYKGKWPYPNFTPTEVYKLDLKLVDKLQAIRTKTGIPMKIESGWRSPEHNENVGGVQDSAHTKGLAVDIRCRNSRERFLLKKAAFEEGFRRIGDGQERNFLHLDIDPSKDQDVEWYY